MEENKKIEEQEMDKVSGGIKLSRRAKIGLGVAGAIGAASLATAGGMVAAKKRHDKKKTGSDSLNEEGEKIVPADGFDDTDPRNHHVSTTYSIAELAGYPEL